MADLPPRRLILTVFGLYAREQPHWLSVASVVRLLADLDVDGASVRSAISRMKRRGVLEAVPVEGQAGYALSEPALELLREGDARIFRRTPSLRSDRWVVVMFSVPEAEREKRHQLRTTLARLGFGTMSPGVWVAPAHLHETALAALSGVRLDEYADVLLAEYAGAGRLAEKVATWWDLDALHERYAAFVEEYRPVRASSRRAVPGPEKAFGLYVPMLTAWRRLPYLDPGLPPDVLPSGWPGGTAARLFTDLHGVLADPAREHAHSLIRG